MTHSDLPATPWRWLVPLIVVGVAWVVTPVLADDWPQWRGAGRLGVWHETGIVDALPDALVVTWRVPIRSGFSGPAVADGRVFITDWAADPESRTMDGTERVLALDEQTGEVLWTHEWPTSYRMLMASFAVGPRATPTVDGDRVYVVGATGVLSCLDVETGELLWRKRYIEDYDTSVPTWGIASAPLVDGDRLITIVGGEPDALVMAFDKRTGDEIWRSLPVTSEMGYAHPVIIRGGWRPPAHHLASDGADVARSGHRPGLLGPTLGGWGRDVGGDARQERRLSVRDAVLQRVDDDAAEPRPAGGHDALEGREPERDAERDRRAALVDHHATDHRRLHLWGRQLRRAVWAGRADRRSPLDERRDDRPGAMGHRVHGAVRRPYFVNNDDGYLMIAQFTPEGYIELDRTKLIEATGSAGYGPRKAFDRVVNWSHPAYANRHIVHRNDREVIRASLDASDY